MPELTQQSLELFLEQLASDPSQAAEKYEVLRLKLVKCLMWKGSAEVRAEALADIIIDRVAAKLTEGVKIEKTDAYACRVLQFVWLEHRRKDQEDPDDADKIPEIPIEPVVPDEPDVRLACLRSCLIHIAKNDEERSLILNYYTSDEEEKDKLRRKSIAERLGIKANALKVRMFRLRERLEKCINECVTVS